LSTFRVAVIDDDEAVRSVLAATIRNAGYEVEAFEDGEAFIEANRPAEFDLVLTDLQMESVSGLDIVRKCREASSPPEVIVVTGFGSVESAVEAMRLGAADYITKPIHYEELIRRIGRLAREKGLERDLGALSGEMRRRQPIGVPIHQSREMSGLLERARVVAETDSPVLILGETGTGKDLVARFIQSHSSRARRPYLTLNCAAIPEQLLESELFGHAKGAFSGADAPRRGLFEEASGGTLFLDEIGSMPASAQAKLLRALEENSVRRVGENRSIPIDVRILSATNRDLPHAIADGTFRDDLYYRLNAVTFVIPPLRERREDIMLLARHFLAEAVRRIGRPARDFTRDAEELLLNYPFPGNVRELRHAVEQAVILSQNELLAARDFAALRGALVATTTARIAAVLPQPKEEITPELIQEALARCRGNRSLAARALGISRSTFYRLWRRLEMPEPESEREPR
jgi:two-component system, NtrC family, response regulator HydG